MNRLAIEYSLPIMSAELSFTTNDTKDVAMATADSLHSQIVSWLQSVQPDREDDVKTRFASGANYTDDDGIVKSTRMDIDLKLKPGTAYQLSLVAAERMHETVVQWVHGECIS